MKLEEYEFIEVQGWHYPKVKTIMNVMDARMVVELPEDDAEVQTSKKVILHPHSWHLCL